MKANGFTLIELLTVLVIMTILMAVATPVILHSIADSQFEASARYVSKTLMLARQEAIVKRKKIAVLFPLEGDKIATCYVDKATGAFDGWTPGQSLVWLKSIGMVESIVTVPAVGPPQPAATAVSGIVWPMTPAPASTCLAIIFRPGGNVSGGDLSPYRIRIIDAVAQTGGPPIVRSAKFFDLEVNCFTGRCKYLTPGA
jgi:prepilin-type N-terminal cleavage/methylation domain-containing protein